MDIAVTVTNVSVKDKRAAIRLILEHNRQFNADASPDIKAITDALPDASVQNIATIKTTLGL